MVDLFGIRYGQLAPVKVFCDTSTLIPRAARYDKKHHSGDNDTVFYFRDITPVLLNSFTL